MNEGSAELPLFSFIVKLAFVDFVEKQSSFVQIERMRFRHTGPVRAMPDAKSETIAYSSARKQGQPSNVIQFTRYAIWTVPPNADENTYAEGAEQYLKQILQGIERRRTAYAQSPIRRFRVVGHLGARAIWTGVADGIPTNDVMYCAMIGADAWFIHVFGPGDRPDVELQSVIGVVEHGGH